MQTSETLVRPSFSCWGAQLVSRGTWSCLRLRRPMLPITNAEKKKTTTRWWQMEESLSPADHQLSPMCSSSCSISWSFRSSSICSSPSLSMPFWAKQITLRCQSRSSSCRNSSTFGLTTTLKPLDSWMSQISISSSKGWPSHTTVADLWFYTRTWVRMQLWGAISFACWRSRPTTSRRKSCFMMCCSSFVTKSISSSSTKNTSKKDRSSRTLSTSSLTKNRPQSTLDWHQLWTTRVEARSTSTKLCVQWDTWILKSSWWLSCRNASAASMTSTPSTQTLSRPATFPMLRGDKWIQKSCSSCVKRAKSPLTM